MKHLLFACAVMALPAAPFAGTSEISFSKPPLRWLWGGFGFHNAETAMTGLMTDEFRNERVLKSFLEIEPTYSRVFAGFAKWSRDDMDRFADWYDLTFRRCDTVLYVVPSRMPMVMEDFDCEAYAEATAKNLDYLIKERDCSRIVYYAVSNEASAGSVWNWFGKADVDGRDRWRIFRDLNRAMFRAFRRHDIDVGLMTSDSSGIPRIKDLEWAVENLNDVTECYCWHYYDRLAVAGDESNWARWMDVFTNVVQMLEQKNERRRLSLGEFGLNGRSTAREESGCAGVMRDGRGYSAKHPDEAHLAALSRAEMGMAALNAGFVSAVSWTFCDYPDPFLGYPGGKSPRDRAEHAAMNRAAFGLDTNYNKWGLFRWDEDDQDYSSYPDLYTMGWLVKLFRRGGRVLPWTTRDHSLRVVAVTNADGSVSIAVLNWGGEKDASLEIPHVVSKAMRVYEYDSANVPYSVFNDLQRVRETIVAAESNGVSLVRVSLKPKSLVFLTTDYADRNPSLVRCLGLEDGILSWDMPQDEFHRYFRVYFKGRQIASTVAARLDVAAKGATDGVLEDFHVTSVDKWCNEGR